MKKLLSFLLGILLIALLSGCGKSVTKTPTESSTDSDTVSAVSQTASSTVSSEVSKIKDLKINFLGDSITAGVGVSAPGNKFVNLVGLKIDTARNYGVSSTSIAYQIKSSVPGKYFCNRHHEMDSDADYIVILGGTNDYGFGDAPLGSPSDATPETFYGSLNYLYSAILNNYPDSKVIVMTPPRMLGDSNLKGHNGYKGKDVATLETYVNIIKEVATGYSLPIIDLYSVSELNPNDPELKAAYFADGVHPNDAGHKIIADLLLEYLKSAE